MEKPELLRRLARLADSDSYSEALSPHAYFYPDNLTNDLTRAQRNRLEQDFMEEGFDYLMSKSD